MIYLTLILEEKAAKCLHKCIDKYKEKRYNKSVET